MFYKQGDKTKILIFEAEGTSLGYMDFTISETTLSMGKVTASELNSSMGISRKVSVSFFSW